MEGSERSAWNWLDVSCMFIAIREEEIDPRSWPANAFGKTCRNGLADWKRLHDNVVSIQETTPTVALGRAVDDKANRQPAFGAN
jgi:hypothetical protein